MRASLRCLSICVHLDDVQNRPSICAPFILTILGKDMRYGYDIASEDAQIEKT